MRQVYFEHLRRAYSASGDEYLDLEPVPEGKVLEVHRVAAWHNNIATTEAIWWYLKIGHEYVWLGDDLPGTTNGPCKDDLDMHLGEGSVLGCYAPSIASTEVLHFVVTGCLWDLEDWRKVQAH